MRMQHPFFDKVIQIYSPVIRITRCCEESRVYLVGNYDSLWLLDKNLFLGVAVWTSLWMDVHSIEGRD